MLSYSKIFTIGEPRLAKLFEGPVEITEKLDGSQVRFGLYEDGLRVASKGKELILEAPEKMFSKAVDYIKQVESRLPVGVTFYAEYLQKPKHNVLEYSKPPQNNLCLWGARAGGRFASHAELADAAKLLDIDAIPLVYSGCIDSVEQVEALLERESYLGLAQIEGVVVKNYAHSLYWNDKEYPVLAGKWVSEKFKEKHKSSWKKEHTGKGEFETFADSFRAEGRWHKAVQHLWESGELEVSPRDIGKLVKEIQADLVAEEKENIKEELWNIFGKDILRTSITGAPEWYKERLLQGAFVG